MRIQRRIDWTFTGRDMPPTKGAHEQTGCKLVCYEDDGSVAWTRSFRSVAEATASFDGDIRAMRKNDCYGWPTAEEMQRALLWT